MTEHVWKEELVNGGPVGDDDFYHCTTCGCSGGGVTNIWGNRVKPKPFLPGPSLDLSEDCDIAREQIIYFIHGCLRSLEVRPRYPIEGVVGLLQNAHKWSSKKIPRVEFAHLVFNCQTCTNLKPENKFYPSLERVRARLVELGFRVEAFPCTKCGEPDVTHTDDKAGPSLCVSCWWAENKAHLWPHRRPAAP